MWFLMIYEMKIVPLTVIRSGRKCVLFNSNSYCLVFMRDFISSHSDPVPVISPLAALPRLSSRWQQSSDPVGLFVLSRNSSRFCFFKARTVSAVVRLPVATPRRLLSARNRVPEPRSLRAVGPSVGDLMWGRLLFSTRCRLHFHRRMPGRAAASPARTAQKSTETRWVGLFLRVFILVRIRIIIIK